MVAVSLKKNFFKQKTAYEISLGLVGSEMCIRDSPYLRGRDIRGVADPAIWDASRGDSIADIADRYGVYFEPGDHKRLPGWMQVHYRLAFDAAGLPMLYVFRNCRDTRRTLPLLRYDAHAPEDVDTRQEDHIADEIRYLCQSDPIAPRPVVQRTPKVFDPLSSD